MYPPQTPKMVLKLYKYMNVKYNLLARRLFLYTIKPITYKQRTANWIVNTVTYIVAMMFK